MGTFKFVPALAFGIFLTLAGAAQAGNSPWSRVREVTPQGDTVQVLDGSKPMADKASNKAVFDIVVSVHYKATEPGYPTGDGVYPTDAGASDDQQNAYEEIIEYLADAVCEASNGAHHLGEVRMFTQGEQAASADIVWNSSEWPRGNLSGFGKNGDHITFGDVFPFDGGPFDALKSTNRASAGYTLGHEWGHYVLGLFDEYVGSEKSTHPIFPRLDDIPPPNPSIMNSQWPAGKTGTTDPFRYLNFSQKDNFSNNTVQGRLYGKSGWEVLTQSTDKDPKTGRAVNEGFLDRTHYTNLDGLAPPPAPEDTPPNYRIELPAAQNTCRSDLDIIWMQNQAELVLAVDTSVSMQFGDLARAVTASKALVDLVDKDRTAIGLVHFNTNVQIDSVPLPITKDPGATPSNRDSLKFYLDQLTAEGSTALYDGTQQAIDLLTQYKTNHDTKAAQMVFVLSDGEDTNSKTSSVDSVIASARSGLVSLNVFAYGDEAPEATLRQMAQETAGIFRVDPGSLGAIQQAFLRALGKTTNNRILRTKQREYVSQGSGLQLPFTMDPTLENLRFIASYDEGSSGNPSGVTFTVTGPVGVVPVTFNCESTGTQTLCMGVVSETDRQAAGYGDWSVQVNNGANTDITVDIVAISSAAPGESYDVTVETAGQNELAYPGPIPITAAVSRAGHPITGLDVQVTHITPTGFEISTGSQPMNDQGIDGDAIAGDGIYTALVDYDGGQFSPDAGPHTFEVQVSNAARNGKYTDAGFSPVHSLPFVNRSGSADPNGNVYSPQSSLVGENFTRTSSVQIYLTEAAIDNHGDDTGNATELPADDSDIAGRIDYAGDVDVFHIADPGTGEELAIRVTDIVLGMEPHLVITRVADGVQVANLTIADSQSSNGYLVANVNAADVVGGLYAAVSHVDASATKGNFNVSAGTVSEADAPASAPVLVASVLPTSRSVRVNTATTFFLTMINTSDTSAAYDVGAYVADITGLTDHEFHITDADTNAIVGNDNVPVLLEPGQAQSFVVAFRPWMAFASTQLNMRIPSFNAADLTPIAGVNTLQFRASNDPVIDMIALNATVGGNGYVDIPGNTGTGFFSAATYNLGTSGNVTARVHTNGASLPVNVTLCRTDGVGACLASPSAEVPFSVATDETATFSVFITGTGNVTDDPAANRVFLEFVDDGNVPVGSTSVAVRTVAE